VRVWCERTVCYTFVPVESFYIIWGVDGVERKAACQAGISDRASSMLRTLLPQTLLSDAFVVC
jgi:hypothetical protein